MGWSGKGKVGGFTRLHQETFKGMGVFTILTVMMVSQLSPYIRTNQIIHFKYVQFVVCPLYLNKVIFKSENKKDYWSLPSLQNQNDSWVILSMVLRGTSTLLVPSLLYLEALCAHFCWPLRMCIPVSLPLSPWESPFAGNPGPSTQARHCQLSFPSVNMFLLQSYLGTQMLLLLLLLSHFSCV